MLYRFAKEYESRNRASLGESYSLANPINAFLVVKRLTADWNYVETLMKQNMAEGKRTRWSHSYCVC